MSRIAVLHEHFIAHPNTTADEIAVLTTLALHASRTDSTCFPTQGLLATLLGRSRPWVNKVINRLVELGLVERTHRTRNDGGDRSCLYRLVLPAGVSNPVPKAKGTVIASQQHDTGSHTDDSITPVQELKQDAQTASASDILSPSSINRPSELVMPSDDWQPSDDDLIWACNTHPTADLQAHTDRFLNRCQAKGYRYRPDGIGRAWRSWLTDDLARAKSAPRWGGSSRSMAAQAKFDAWAGVAARHSAHGVRYAE